MVTGQIGSSRGTVAGSALACYELIAYMYAATRSVLLWGVTLSVHVDDLAMTYTHVRAREALRRFQRAAAVMVVEFEQQLGLPFEAEKSSSDPIKRLRSLRRRRWAGTLARRPGLCVGSG